MGRARNTLGETGIAQELYVGNSSLKRTFGSYTWIACYTSRYYVCALGQGVCWVSLA
jgi:hypothetical protein